jgi:hypothetical protein
MKRQFFVIFLIIINNLNAQNDIKNFFCVDTIIKSEKILLKDISSGEIVFDINKEFIAYNLTTENKNIIPIGIYKKLNKSYIELNLIIPDSIKINEKSNIVNIRLSKNFIIVFYSNFYITFNINFNNSTANFNEITYLEREYGQFHLIKDSLIFCYKIYNSSGGEKVYLSKYNLFKKTPIKNIKPVFDCILLSHFSPNNWIDINENYIAFSQACDYNITIMNHDFEEISVLKREINEWKRLNKDTIALYNEKRPYQIIRDINNINSHNISKIEGVWWLNDKTLLVRYYLSENPNDIISNRYFDIYNVENNTNKLIYSNLKDGGVKLSVEDTTTKCNYYLLSWTNESFIANNSFIILKSTAPIDYFNKTLGDVFKEQNKYMKSNPPFTGIWIYKWNEKKNY